MRRWAIAFAAVALLMWPATGRVTERPVCPAVKLPPIALPHLRDALRSGRPVEIVALGSSSTAGAQASAPDRTYPAILQTALREAFPGATLDVINRGIGGQDAIEELGRIGPDVLAASPSLVIWQVGANGAMRHTDPAEFRREIDRGLRQMEAAGIDVILMDNQRSPAILASPTHAEFDQVLADVAAQDGARMFARGRLMELWQEQGHPYAEFLSGDGIHHNDHGYECVARALAQTIVDGLGNGGGQLRTAIGPVTSGRKPSP